MIIPIALFLSACSTSNSNAPPPVIQLTPQQKTEIEHSVLALLKDPESARFGPMRAGTVAGATAVCGWVNAKNSFGGYTGMELFYSRFENGRFNTSVEKDASALTCTMLGLTPPRS